MTMDELQAIRDVYNDAAVPTAADLADARARLSSLTTPPKPSPGRPLRWAVPGLAAAAVAAVVLVVTSTGGALHQRRPQPVGAEQILLAASQQAARQPATTGRYWHSRVLGTTKGLFVNKVYDPKAVDNSGTDSWWAPSLSIDDVIYTKSAKLSSLTDKQLQDFGGMKRVGGSWLEQRTTGASKRGYQQVCQEKHETCAPLTWKQAGALATNRQALFTALFWTNPKSTTNDLRDAFTFLTSNPLPPQTQAAAYRMLATLPGVRSEGLVTLLGGATGIGIGTVEGPGVGYALVFDKNNRLIGDEERVTNGAIKNQVARHSVLTNGWTNENPQPPA
jgi:hypothetical protein